jgi:hypothetical protein
LTNVYPNNNNKNNNNNKKKKKNNKVKSKPLELRSRVKKSNINYFSKKNSLFTGMVVQNNKQNLNKLWLKFFEKDMILYQYHFFDKDIRYDII